MILETKEDFEKAIIAEKKIKQKVIFYTEEDSELSPIVVDSEKPKIGDLYKGGIYIGSYNGKDVVMALKDEEDDRVINYKIDFDADDQQEAVEYLDCRAPKDHYFIAIETPVTHFYSEKSTTPCWSWGYTRTTWIFVDSLAEIDKYRQMVGKMADETLTEEDF